MQKEMLGVRGQKAARHTRAWLKGKIIHGKDFVQRRATPLKGKGGGLAGAGQIVYWKS